MGSPSAYREKSGCSNFEILMGGVGLLHHKRLSSKTVNKNQNSLQKTSPQ